MTRGTGPRKRLHGLVHKDRPNRKFWPVEKTDVTAPLEPIDMDLVTTECCARLWLAVVEQMFIDAKWNGRRPEKKAYDGQWKDRRKDRAAAMRFLMSRSNEFDLVCAAAGIDPDVIADKADELFRGDPTWKRLRAKMIGADNDSTTTKRGGDPR